MDEQTPQTPLESRKLPGVYELFQETITLFRNRYETLLPILLIGFAASILSSAVSPKMQGLFLLALLLNLFITLLSRIALIYAYAHEAPSTQSYTFFYHKAWAIFLQYLWVAILSGIFVAAGFMLVIIPAIIIGVYLSFTTFITVLEGVYGMKSLTQSYMYVRGDWWGIFWRFVFFFIVLGILSGLVGYIMNFAGSANSVPLLIVQNAFDYFILTPLSVGYSYILYTELRSRKAGPIMEGNVERVRNYFFGMIVAAVIFIVLIYVIFGAQIKQTYREFKGRIQHTEAPTAASESALPFS